MKVRQLRAAVTCPVAPPPPGRTAGRLAAWARRRPLLAVFWVVSAVTVICILAIDRPLALALKAQEGSDLVAFFRVLTVLGFGTPWFLGAGLAWLGCTAAARLAMVVETAARLRHYARSALYVLAALAVGGTVVPVLKVVFGRLRPRYLFESGIYGFAPFTFHLGSISFPSGHTQTIWTAMIALVFVFPRYDLAFLAIAVLVGLSRVMITVHFLGDMVMGAYLGAAAAILVRRWFERNGEEVRIRLARDARLLAE